MDIDVKKKFGHYWNAEGLNKYAFIFHVYKNNNNISRCNDKLTLCSEQMCIDHYFKFKQICKKCWKMLSKKEQEELIHYFCVKRLKG